MELQWSNGVTYKNAIKVALVYLSVAGKRCRNYWIVPDWNLLWFSPVFSIMKSTDCEWDCTLRKVFFMMNGESLISSLHHKPSSHEHTSVRVNTLLVHFQYSTEPSSTWLYSLLTTNGSVFYWKLYTYCGNGSSKTFVGASCSVTGGPTKTDQYFGTLGFFFVLRQRSHEENTEYEKQGIYAQEYSRYMLSSWLATFVFVWQFVTVGRSSLTAIRLWKVSFLLYQRQQLSVFHSFPTRET